MLLYFLSLDEQPGVLQQCVETSEHCNIRSVDMKRSYRIIRLAWYLCVGITSSTYWTEFGWWFIPVCVTILLLGEALIYKVFTALTSK